MPSRSPPPRPAGGKPGSKPGATRQQIERRERFTRARRESLRPAEADGPAILYGWHTVTAALGNPARQIRKFLATENAARRLAGEGIAQTPEIVRPSAIDERLLPDVRGEDRAVALGERIGQPRAELREEVVEQTGREVECEHGFVPAGLAEPPPVPVDLERVRLHRGRGVLALGGEQIPEGGVLGEDRGRHARDRLPLREVGRPGRDRRRRLEQRQLQVRGSGDERDGIRTQVRERHAVDPHRPAPAAERLRTWTTPSRLDHRLSRLAAGTLDPAPAVERAPPRRSGSHIGANPRGLRPHLAADSQHVTDRHN